MATKKGKKPANKPGKKGAMKPMMNNSMADAAKKMMGTFKGMVGGH